MDQTGVLILVISSLLAFPVAWGRTIIQPRNLKFGPQRGGALVAAAGPLTNLTFALLLAVGLRLTEAGGCVTPGLHTFLGENIGNGSIVFFFNLAIYINLFLFIFNLIPVPPLDGFSILSGFLTTRQMYSLAPLVQYGPMLLFLIIILLSTGNLGSTLYGPVYSIGGSILPGFPNVTLCSPPGY